MMLMLPKRRFSESEAAATVGVVTHAGRNQRQNHRQDSSSVSIFLSPAAAFCKGSNKRASSSSSSRREGGSFAAVSFRTECAAHRVVAVEASQR
jgi:hypothetical protein